MGKRYGRWETTGSVDEGGQGHILLVRDTTGELAGQFILKRLKNSKRMDLSLRRGKRSHRRPRTWRRAWSSRSAGVEIAARDREGTLAVPSHSRIRDRA